MAWPFRSLPLLCLALFPSSASAMPATSLLQSLESAAQLFAAHRDAVVRVLCLFHREDGTAVARMGSGFFFDGDGHVATTAGAIDGAEEIFVSYGHRSSRAHAIGSDAETRVAVLALDEASPPYPCLSLGEGMELPPPLTPLLAIACEIGLDPAPSLGIVQAEQICHGGNSFATSLIRSSLPSNAGAPGSPVFDLRGNFVGMLMASIPQVDGSFLFPARALRRVLRDILPYGSVHHAYAGLDTRLERDEEGDFFAIVQAVVPHSPAAEANLCPGDRILAIDDVPIRGPAELCDAVFFALPGAPLSLKIQRGGDIFRVALRMAIRRWDGQGAE
ncbi:MAG: S1C family serine protease [Puniceicoccales bacterium]|jgi:S1-C subfamily serine protease|nr:S1C family serine protease [Puniceicoccales bacterium]